MKNIYFILVDGFKVHEGEAFYTYLVNFSINNIKKRSKRHPKVHAYYEQGAVIRYYDSDGNLHEYIKSEKVQLGKWYNYDETTLEYIKGIEELHKVLTTTTLSKVTVSFDYSEAERNENTALRILKELKIRSIKGWIPTIVDGCTLYFTRVF